MFDAKQFWEEKLDEGFVHLAKKVYKLKTGDVSPQWQNKLDKVLNDLDDLTGDWVDWNL